ncbi:MAG: M42 family peptidase [Clostridia bacterium]
MVIENLKTLCNLSGVSGFENTVRDYIVKEITPFVNKVIVDNIGNVIAIKNGINERSKKLMLCAHMDEVGLIVTSITTDGYIKFAAVGGIDERILIGKEVKIGGSMLNGVIGVCPVHLLTKKEREETVKIDDLYIDIGANDKSKAESLVKLGDFIAFDNNFEILGSNIKSKALDDRIGCQILIDLLKSSLNYNIVCAFTVKEEIGCIGATVAANIIKPDVAIILETTTANDIPQVNDDKKVTSINKGVVIPFMDKGTIYDKELYNLATNTASANNIKWQTKTQIAGGNDSKAIQQTTFGVKVLCLSVPCRYLHTSKTIASYKDIEATENLLRILIDKI